MKCWSPTTDRPTVAGARPRRPARGSCGSHEKGYGSALIGGIDAARGRFVIMARCRRQLRFLAARCFVDGLRAGNTMVIGHRFRGGIRPGAMPLLHRYLGNPVLSFAGRLFFSSGSATSIAACAASIARRRCKLGLHAPAWSSRAK